MKPSDPSKTFDAFYYSHSCGKPYGRDREWLKFFAGIADRIVSNVLGAEKPKTVLDAGCAWGFLVEALRERGIDAFGIDISEYAIQNVIPEYKPYCRVASVTEPLPQRYDLIVSIEVLEHLPRQDAEKAVANLCRFSDDILFSSSPFDYKEATHVNVQPPEYWAELFARAGFIHDIDFDASFITPWAMRFRKGVEPFPRVMAYYERRLWLLSQENKARRELGIEQRNELSSKEQEIQKILPQLLEKDLLIHQKESELQDIRNSRSWKILVRAQNARLRFIPPGTAREQWMYTVLRGLNSLRRDGFTGFVRRLNEKASRRMQMSLLRLRHRRKLASQSTSVEAVQYLPPVPDHQASAAVVICVHNALEDVVRCLESIIRYTTPPYTLILVDDGSDDETRRYLQEFASAQGASLLRNVTARGYTFAANQGLRASSADYTILLNSDTVVTSRWLDRMIFCGETDPKIGIIGPLSNTASWQSVPEILNRRGDWSDNSLPKGISVAEMGERIARYSARQYPRIPFLNGFCLMIKRGLIDAIGYLDEETFGMGYGEENDYCLRARKAGFDLAVADDTYIFHAQSRSYSNERRLELIKRTDPLLIEKHGHAIISDGVEACRNDRVMLGNRARIHFMAQRENKISEGLKRWEGRRILFVLPVAEPGGGGHVVLQEAEAMQKMGVDVDLVNFTGYKPYFESAYPSASIPVLYIDQPRLSAGMLAKYDAVVGTAYHSLDWMAEPASGIKMPVRGYYIQDFEPDFFPAGSSEYKTAWGSYTRFPDLVRFTKTDWNCSLVKEKIGVDSAVVGPSVDIELFRPRRRKDPDWPSRPLRITAMVRPSTPRRNAALTMQILREADRKYKGAIEIILFGCLPEDPDFRRLPTDFQWKHAGVLTRPQLANLLNEVDIFADFSHFQAMGLTSMEAMACGAAVLIPQAGGAGSFAAHEKNALVIDSSSPDACLAGLERLIKEEDLRKSLQAQALWDMCQFFPENAAYNILEVLFTSLPAKSS